MNPPICLLNSPSSAQPIATGVNRKQGWPAHDWIQTNVEVQGARPEESPVVENGRELHLRLVRGTTDSKPQAASRKPQAASRKPQATATPAFRKDMERQNFDYLLYMGHDDNWDAAGAAGPVDDGNQEGAGGNGQENELQPQALVPKGMEGTEGVQSVPHSETVGKMDVRDRRQTAGEASHPMKLVARTDEEKPTLM
ncbi:hypothetical protein ACRRTK_001888 [Alexandromys fortis]